MYHVTSNNFSNNFVYWHEHASRMSSRNLISRMESALCTLLFCKRLGLNSLGNIVLLGGGEEERQ